MVAAALVTVAGCSTPSSEGRATTPSKDDGPLRYTGSGFSVLAPSTETTSIAFGSLELCAQDPVVVTSISAVEPRGGAQVVGWGHRPNPLATGGTLLGAEPASLASFGFTAEPLSLPSDCSGPEGAAPEFGVQLTRGPGAQVSYVVGLKVSYSENGQPRTLDVPWTLGYCGTGSATEPSALACPAG